MTLALWLSAIVALSLLPFDTIAFMAPSLADNVIHAAAYGIGALIACLAFSRPLLVWTTTSLIGTVVEFGQGWVGTGRSPEFEEAIANGLGALLGVTLALAMRAGSHWIEQRR